jgi:hypothetical protein
LKRSTSIVLLLSGALATTVGLAIYNAQDETPPEPTGAIIPADQLSADQELENNTYVPGSGYYHSVSHNWHPYPFNWYSPGRGYYYGGDWHTSGFNGVMPTRSRPSAAAVASARSQGSSGSTSSHFAQGASSGGNGSSAGHSSSSGSHSSSISRGGFGSSSHGGGSAHGSGS